MDIKPDDLYLQVTEVYKRYTNPEAISNTFVSMNSAITYCRQIHVKIIVLSNHE
jgi:hypothetical protein